MRNFLMAAMLLFACVSFTQAQETSFGIKAGLNFASLNGDDVADELEMLTSLHFGVVAEFGLSEKFSIQPEVIYSGQGASLDDELLKLDYINVPVLAKYYIIQGLSLEAGPQIGFNVNSEYEFDGETEDVENVKTTNFAAALGLGYKLPIGLFFQARYNLGLSNAFDGVEGFDSDAKNNVLQFSVGYKF